MFIPQRPYLPLGTLREAIVYPGTRQISDDRIRALMEDCRIGYLANHLDEEADWTMSFPWANSSALPL